MVSAPCADFTGRPQSTAMASRPIVPRVVASSFFEGDMELLEDLVELGGQLLVEIELFDPIGDFPSLHGCGCCFCQSLMPEIPSEWIF